MAFSQRNLWWRFKRLGRSRYNMGQMGCVVTSLAWLMYQKGYHTNPGAFCDWLNRNGGFNESGQIYHDAVSRYTNHQYSWKEGTGPLQMIVVQWGNVTHWVADVSSFGGPGGLVDDPYDGKRKPVVQHYWRITPRRVHIG